MWLKKNSAQDKDYTWNLAGEVIEHVDAMEVF